MFFGKSYEFSETVIEHRRAAAFVFTLLSSSDSLSTGYKQLS